MSEPAFNIAQFIKETAEAHQRLVQQGIEIGEGRWHRVARGLDAAYRKAVLDPETKIPSYLMASLEVLAALLPAEAPQQQPSKVASP